MADKKIGTLIKVLPIKREINSTTTYDSLLIFYRDENGQKQVKYVDRAEVPYYLIKDRESQEAITPPLFIEKDKVEKFTTYSDLLYRELCVKTGLLDYWDRCGYSTNKRNIENILKHNYIYGADMNLADKYIKDFMEEYEPDINYKLHKVYFDIEVDLFPKGLNHPGYIGFPSEDIAPCPVNIITLLDAKTHILYTFSNKNSLNKSQQEFINNYQTNSSAVKSDIMNNVFERNGIMINDVDIMFFNSEEEMIEGFFNKLHLLDPDIVAAWNMVFDVQTLMNRLKKLYSKKKELKENNINGFDQMLSTVCDSKYMLTQNDKGEQVYLSPKAYYKSNKGTAIVNRMDEFTVLDGAVWMDQMLLYANIRKSNGVKESYSLEAIAEEELGSEKLDYTGYTIGNLPWKNFYLFVKYNIFDVILLDALESQNLDFDMVQKLCEVTNTRKLKVFKKTISLKNYVSKFAEMQGYIMNNNKNANYGDDSDYFRDNYLDTKQLKEADPSYLELFNKKENFGAYVGNPMLNDYEGIKDINGNQSMFIYENVFDEDFSSLYPSIIQAYNLDSYSLVGKFYLLDDHIKKKLAEKYDYTSELFAVSKNEEADAEADATTSELGTTLVDSLTSHNWGAIGEKYFDLPNTTEMINELKNKKK